MPGCVMRDTGYIFDSQEKELERVEASPVLIPLSDEEAYPVYPQYRWMWNKIRLCEEQKLEAFPHGIEPTEFPVFSKPITNIAGLSNGAEKLRDWKDWYYKAGHFWMSHLDGPQLSIDVAVVDGIMKWWHIMTPEKDFNGSFTSWKTTRDVGLASFPIEDWIALHFKSHTGVVCFETIGEHIIEVVPRCSAQWLDFWGHDWASSLLDLYNNSVWIPAGEPIEGTSIVIRVPRHFGPLCPYVKSEEMLTTLADEVSSLYLPWYKDIPLEDIPDDNHSYRIAVVNIASTDAEEVQYYRDRVKRLIDFKV